MNILSCFRYSNCWDTKQNAKGDKMVISLKNLKVAKKDHPIYGGKIQTYPILLSNKKTDDLRKKDKKKIKK